MPDRLFPADASAGGSQVVPGIVGISYGVSPWGKQLSSGLYPSASCVWSTPSTHPLTEIFSRKVASREYPAGAAVRGRSLAY